MNATDVVANLDESFASAVPYSSAAGGYGAAVNVVHAWHTATAATTISLKCRGQANGPGGPTNLYTHDPVLSVIKVGTLH